MFDPVSIGLAIKAATTAIEMAKKGVALYKEIKATAGDVSGVLKDLKDQYHKIASPSPEQTRQYNEEVKRVQQVAKANPHDVLNDIWDHLGNFVDEYDKVVKAYIAEEASAPNYFNGATTFNSAVSFSETSTFSKNTIVSVTDNTNAALRVTQLGTANALEIEDSTNPDATPFIVDASGRLIQIVLCNIQRVV